MSRAARESSAVALAIILQEALGGPRRVTTQVKLSGLHLGPLLSRGGQRHLKFRQGRERHGFEHL